VIVEQSHVGVRARAVDAREADGEDVQRVADRLLVVLFVVASGSSPALWDALP
jgi:hypothetical protein